jgi:hypothetical protein
VLTVVAMTVASVVTALVVPRALSMTGRITVSSGLGVIGESTPYVVLATLDGGRACEEAGQRESDQNQESAHWTSEPKRAEHRSGRGGVAEQGQPE